MEFVKYDPTRRRNRVPPSIFSLIGTIVKETDKSVLIQKINGKGRFGINKDNWINNLTVGQPATFQITISTFVGKDTNMIWTTPRMQSAFPLEGEIQKDHPGFIGERSGVIVDYFNTDIEDLWIVKFTTNTGESFYLRFETKQKPMNKPCTIEMDFHSTAILINSSGNAWESLKKIESTNEVGEPIEIDVNRWFSTLTVRKITYAV